MIRLSPLVRRITAPNPSIMTGAGTNTYLVGTNEVAVIDPGPDDPQHIAALIQAVEGVRIRWVLLTHTHRDHAPGAGPLALQTGAEILAFGHPHVTPDRTIGDGDVLATIGFTLEVLYTPGHASDHLCFFLREEAALFAGDLIMSGSTVVISPPDGDMAAYLRSLERLRQRRIARIYPGHGEVIEHPGMIIDEYIHHRRMREAQVLDALKAWPLRIADLVVQIYAGLPETLHPLAARSVYAHLLKLKSEGKVTGADRESEWRLLSRD